MKNRFPVKKKLLIISVLIVFYIFSCDQNGFEGLIRKDPRDIIIDVDNVIFNAENETNVWQQGPGVNKIVFTISLEGADGNIKKEMKTVDVDSTYKYTRVSIPVTGILTGIDAMAYKGTALLYSVSIVDKSSYDSLYGWEIFANNINCIANFSF